MTVQEIGRSDIACDGVGGGALADLAEFFLHSEGWGLVAAPPCTPKDVDVLVKAISPSHLLRPGVRQGFDSIGSKGSIEEIGKMQIGSWTYLGADPGSHLQL